MHHATDAEWSVVVRRQLENIALLLCALALFLRSRFCCCAIISMSWMNIPPGQRSRRLIANVAYLNWHFFLVRAVLYFVLLGGVAFLLRRFSVAPGSRRQSAVHHLDAQGRLCRSAASLRSALTFRRFRLADGTELPLVLHHVGPVHFCRGRRQLDVAARARDHGAAQSRLSQNVVTLEHYHIMGKWMLAFCVFWAYIGFSQYMLYWYANIPEETQYFLVRNTESWWPLSLLLVVGRFFGPFAILLLQRESRNARINSACVAGWIMLMQALDMYIIVLPALHGTGVHLSIWDFLCPIAIGCSLAFLYLRIIGKTSLFRCAIRA